MRTHTTSPLAAIEPRLRPLLPADLYAAAWINPNSETLMKVFEHLRTLQRLLYDYLPRPLLSNLPAPGEMVYEWQEGTLMFTDLAGFTPLMEANAKHGEEGAQALLRLLNSYFAAMIEILSKSGGHLLEFTGDAMLVQFMADIRRADAAQAVRAGLRMQREMAARFSQIETEQGVYSLGMRVGLHTGQFLTANIGTPRRMEHVMLGTAVQQTKKAEGAGKVGRVNLTEATYERIKNDYRCEPGENNHWLVVDDLADKDLGTYDISAATRRLPSAVLFDRSVEGLIGEIEKMVAQIEPMACYIPLPILNLMISSTLRRHIEPQFDNPTVIFVNLIGIPQSADLAKGGEEEHLVTVYSRLFALINAAAEARGGVLKKVTYHLYGSDMMILFGTPVSYTDDPLRAVAAALAIREIIDSEADLFIREQKVEVACQLGIARGSVFTAEIGEPRGRREFNVLSDTVNTAARLMSRAQYSQILMTQAVYDAVKHQFQCEDLGAVSLKGKATPTPLYALQSVLAEEKIQRA